MKRILCLWLPNWPVQRLVVARPELKYQPIVLHARDPRRGQYVAACSTAARRRGIRVGMPLSEATSLAQKASRAKDRSPAAALYLEPHDPAADLEALNELAEQCEWFSPVVGVEQDTPLGADRRPAAPESLLMDVTHVGHLFGGEAGLAEQLTRWFRDEGYLVHVSVANTIGAAWAGSRLGIGNLRFGIWNSDTGSQISDLKSQIPNSQSQILPVSVLRLPAETVKLLARLGIETVDQLLRLPRASLSSRFGDELLRRLDQATGAIEEVIVARRSPPAFTAEWLLEHPTDRRDSIDFVLSQLVDRVSCQLSARGAGVLQLECWLESSKAAEHAQQAREVPVLRIRVDLFRPTADPWHLMELVRMQLESLALRAPVEQVRVDAVVTAKLEQRQTDLFADHVRGAARHLSDLVDRLGARLGRQAVLRARLESDVQPEQAYRLTSLTEEARKGTQKGIARKKTADPAARPLQLETAPVPLQVIAVAPDGPPVRVLDRGRMRRVLRHWGPERIETGWWRGPTVRRDYYRVETHTGERLWLFRRLSDGQWFRHGRFD